MGRNYQNTLGELIIANEFLQSTEFYLLTGLNLKIISRPLSSLKKIL